MKQKVCKLAYLPSLITIGVFTFASLFGTLQNVYPDFRVFAGEKSLCLE